MTIQNIYSQYKIMPNLQEHQLRVAGVAQIICDSIKDRQIDTKNIVIACLLHDMGNIIKFQLEMYPAFLAPKGLDYWRNVKEEFIKKYGKDEHAATIKISTEILQNIKYQISNLKKSLNSNSKIQKKNALCQIKNPVPRILDILYTIGFSNAKQSFETDDFGKKIAAYADMRVKPFGVASIQERLSDGRLRFNTLKSNSSISFEEMAKYFQKIENQIFLYCSIKPDDITEVEVQKVIPKVRSVFHNHSSDQINHQLH